MNQHKLPLPKDRRPFTKTKEALKRYDEEYPPLLKKMLAANDSKEVFDVLGEMTALEESVGAAFAEDTHDINDPDTCRKVVRPCDWLRSLVGNFTP